VKKRGGLFKGKGKGKAKGPKGLGKRPKGGKRGTRTRPLQPSSSIQVQASQARSIFADEAKNEDIDIEIVNYDDEPDYTKEYPEYEANPQIANDFIAEVAAAEVEEPEEPVEEAEEAEEPQPDVQRSEIKLSDLVAITSQQAADFGIQSAQSVSAGAGEGLGRMFNYAPQVPANNNNNNNNNNNVVVTPTSKQCTTCFGAGADTASTLAACDANTTIETCDDYDVCMIEVRRRNGQIVDMRTGCKAKHACLNLQRINFYGVTQPFYTQCRPEDPLTGRRFGASVCRQCFPTCDSGASDCFDTTDGIRTTAGVNIDIVDPTSNCASPADCTVGRSFWDANLFLCATAPTLTTPLSECTNAAYPPEYDGYSATVHHN